MKELGINLGKIPLRLSHYSSGTARRLSERQVQYKPRSVVLELLFQFPEVAYEYRHSEVGQLARILIIDSGPPTPYA